jgi:hypothetical protein
LSLSTFPQHFRRIIEPLEKQPVREEIGTDDAFERAVELISPRPLSPA